MKRCPYCKSEFDGVLSYCPVCGAEIEKNRYVQKSEAYSIQETIAKNNAYVCKTEKRKKKNIGVIIAVTAIVAIISLTGLMVFQRFKSCPATEIYEKGIAYYYAEDYSVALPYIQKAADKGNANAMFTIGEMCRYGYGVKKDCHLAVKWYKQAAENGNPEAMKELGRLYSYGGDGVDTADENESKSWYSHAVMKYMEGAEKGNSDAMCHLGAMYQNGEGVEENFKEAIRWYKKAADAGNITGMFSVAVLYDPDFYTAGVRDQIEENEEESIMWYKKAAEAGDLLSMCILVDTYNRNNKDDAEEFSKWSKKFSEKILSSKTTGNYKLSVAQEIHEVSDRLYTSWQTTSGSCTGTGSSLYGEVLDAELGCVYNKLRDSLSKGKIKDLDIEQQKWLKCREAKAIAAAKECEGGTLEGAMYADASNEETQKRILYLADYYDNIANKK